MNQADTIYVLGASGGKDSTATGLHLREQGITFRATFFDTGWEHHDTYRYVLETLPRALGVDVAWRRHLPELNGLQEAVARDVERVLDLPTDNPWGDRRSAMVRWCVRKAMFPSRTRRWCTQEMKFRLARAEMQAEHRRRRLPVNVVGVRAAESAARADLPERELDADLDAMVWRPIIDWSVEDVRAIHRRHGIAPNPLYLREAGARRVGCWPCIQAGKAELRLLARDERRIQAMELLERRVGQLAALRRKRNGKEPLKRLPHFFQGNRSDRGEDGKIPCMPIRERLEWARTSRGGRQLMLDLPSNSGCMRWGMCDQPDTGDE